MNERQMIFLDTLEKSLGVLTSALIKSQTPREEYDLWMQNSEFKKNVEAINESSIDFVENQLLKQIKDGDLSAIQFYLKTKGKKRGY